ncbi:uncharacterized protein LOC132380631 [Hypanus sabinus]|uniref:uncharacterized protein LOC132380631 n=1 Tax=Hypanus sabinus TaxID=79690 RepID=UPI0028C3F9F3|nr:uncharacterized protein LOC132380631 [Hypanus sabinus]
MTQKVGGGVDSVEDCRRLQRDIDRMQKWAEKWQMEFNLEKCEVVHFGRTNSKAEYKVNGRILGSVEEQRDLGVHVHRSLKVASQVDRVVKKVYRVLTFISQGKEFKQRDVMMQLYKTWVRPHLEYCIQFWSPHYRKDVEALERVQRRFTRMLPGLESMNYDQRLRLYCLERRRMTGNMIEVYKMLRGIDRVDSQRLFPRAPLLSTSGHGFKLRGGKFKGDIRGRVFTQRVVGAWNARPESVVEAYTLVKFNRLLDWYMEEFKVGVIWEAGFEGQHNIVGQRACNVLYYSMFYVLSLPGLEIAPSQNARLQWIVRSAEKIIGVSLPTITDIYTTRCIRKGNSIMKDPTHPSHKFFSLLPSGKRY